MDKAIMPECFADTLLIETLVPSKTGYNHKHSCLKVEAAMKNSNSFAVGVIDKDKKAIRYLEQFEVIDEIENSLLLWKHKSKFQFIIQIYPALERWILNVCKSEEIQVKEHLNSLDKLKKVTKSISSEENADLKELFSLIRQKQNNISIRKLTTWISILKEQNYNVDINELKNV